MSNIVSGDRRARRSAAGAAPINYAALDTPHSSDETDGSASEQASSSEDVSDANGSEGSLSYLFLLGFPCASATTSSRTAIAPFVTRACIGKDVCQTNVAPWLYAKSQS